VLARRGRARFLSHLETQEAVLRALRRARLPLARSSGFHPRPRVSLLTALPVGAEAEALVVLAGLREPVARAAIESSLSRALPGGLSLRAARLAPAGERKRLVKVRWETWVVNAELGRAIGREDLEAACSPAHYAELVCVRGEREVRLGERVRLLRALHLAAEGRRALLLVSVERGEGAVPAAAEVVRAVLSEWSPSVRRVALCGIGRQGEEN